MRLVSGQLIKEPQHILSGPAYVACLSLGIIGACVLCFSNGSYAIQVLRGGFASYGEYYVARVEYSQLQVSVWAIHAIAFGIQICVPLAALVALWRPHEFVAGIGGFFG